jgi:hypothetical protein
MVSNREAEATILKVEEVSLVKDAIFGQNDFTIWSQESWY